MTTETLPAAGRIPLRLMVNGFAPSWLAAVTGAGGVIDGSLFRG
jgi:hypothetical protein